MTGKLNLIRLNMLATVNANKNLTVANEFILEIKKTY